MSHNLSVNVDARLTRAHTFDPEQRFKDDCAELSDKQLLTATLQIPNAASDLNVVADLKAKSLRIGMEVAAPRDKQRTSARLNWLLRQLRGADAENLFVRIIWPTRAQDIVCSLASLRDGNANVDQGAGQAPRAFEVFYVTSDARRFTGRRTFIEELETAVPIFYERVGQHLEAWRPKPPKPTKTVDSQPAPSSEGHIVETETAASREREHPESPKAGNQHTDLLEIPPFLRRI